MALSIKAIKGTQDILPEQSYKLRFVENKLLEIASIYGFNEIRTPVFEYTELFNRSVGDTTDVVQKEMYTFNDNGGRSISLRPEGTAGAVRAFLEHGMHNLPLPQKVSYITSCYRYEKPQAGRLREFHQFGVECFGSDSPVADAEVISLAKRCFDVLGVKNLSLEINSIGCPTCRKNYTNALKEYFGSKSDDLCDTCKDRLERNPMRILDCKSPVCKEISANAPTVLDFLCDDCQQHFEKVKKHLDALKIEYKVNAKIVRGLDYYTKTVFEFVSNDLGAQSTVCGGGRYDRLIEQIGGQPTSALGFGMGIERLMLILEAQNIELPEQPDCTLYVAPMGERATVKANEICYNLRQEGFCAVTDLSGRGLKAQMKYANKIGAKFTLVLGEDEINSNKAKLKNMDDSTEVEVELNEQLVEVIYNKNIELQFKQLQDSID